MKKITVVARALLVLFSLCSLLASTAQAHDPGLSAADVRIGKQRITADLTFAPSDVQALVLTTTIGPTAPRLEELARAALEVEVDGRRVLSDRAQIQNDESNATHFHIEFPATAGLHLELRSRILSSLSRGHRQYVSIKDEQGNLLGERMLDATSDSFQIRLGVTASSDGCRSFLQFLALGVEHILTGYDHLAFLLGLMIVGASFRAVAKIITSFTLAHSITLALATLDLVSLSPSVVEPLIAASIVYVGIENICRRDLKLRWLLTFGFGLVHGFGFASALKELGIGSGASAAVPLLSFNLGVELGQIAIAAILLPLIWKLRERPVWVTRYTPAFSSLIALAGGLWFLQRALG